MPDLLLFGATGYTGRLTAQALASRGASFALAGRNATKLEALAQEMGAEDIRIARAGDVDALTDALHDVRVLVTCVGPFAELGDSGAEAALRAGVHYVDSSGEGDFIARLIARHDQCARRRGVAMAPAMGFDEAPADVAATLAVEGLRRPQLTLTYAVPGVASAGTVRSALGILASKSPWLIDGKRAWRGFGEAQRWAPMPWPLGPRRSTSYPFAEAYLAPRHLELHGLRTLATVGAGRRVALKATLPLLRASLAAPSLRSALDALVSRLKQAPDDDTREKARWTILAEASDGKAWRNVALQGRDPYGLTAELLAAAGVEMARPSYARSGVCAPVEAMGLEGLMKELSSQDVRTEVYGPR